MREFGIRLALGASRRTLVRLVLRRNFKLISVALIVGAMLSLAVTTLARRFLFGVAAADPATFGAMALLLRTLQRHVTARSSYLNRPPPRWSRERSVVS
jgi:ABC-type antimicrobial peptide transport system permease subunit